MMEVLENMGGGAMAWEGKEGKGEEGFRKVRKKGRQREGKKERMGRARI